MKKELGPMARLHGGPDNKAIGGVNSTGPEAMSEISKNIPPKSDTIRVSRKYKPGDFVEEYEFEKEIKKQTGAFPQLSVQDYSKVKVDDRGRNIVVKVEKGPTALKGTDPVKVNKGGSVGPDMKKIIKAGKEAVTQAVFGPSKGMYNLAKKAFNYLDDDPSGKAKPVPQMKMNRTVTPLKKETGSFTRTVEPLKKQRFKDSKTPLKRFKDSKRPLGPQATRPPRGTKEEMDERKREKRNERVENRLDKNLKKKLKKSSRVQSKLDDGRITEALADQKQRKIFKYDDKKEERKRFNYNR